MLRIVTRLVLHDCGTLLHCRLGSAEHGIRQPLFFFFPDELTFRARLESSRRGSWWKLLNILLVEGVFQSILIVEDVFDSCWRKLFPYEVEVRNVMMIEVFDLLKVFSIHLEARGYCEQSFRTALSGRGQIRADTSDGFCKEVRLAVAAACRANTSVAPISRG
jgi:hypothetical protein